MIVTNASKSEEALAIFAFDFGDAEFYLKPGSSKTFKAVASVGYTLTVVPNSPGIDRYGDSLRELRDWLLDISLDARASPEDVVDVFGQLLLVQTAFQQLDGSEGAQSCSHKIGDGVDSHTTMTWTDTVAGTGLWVLNCG